MTAIIRYAFLATIFFSHHCYSFGDLMLTAKQRSNIDSMRVNQDLLKAENKTEAFEQKKIIHINGFFFKGEDRKESGVVWVNGMKVDKTIPGSRIQLKRINEKNQTVVIQDEKSNGRNELKAGQKIVLESGQIKDSYEP